MGRRCPAVRPYFEAVQAARSADPNAVLRYLAGGKVKNKIARMVGFLGKVFGPLGMVEALWTGALPWGFALNCVTNDVIWWVPFALILKYAWVRNTTA